MPEINILNKGFWSRERQIDFKRMYRRLSLFGIFGLTTDVNIPNSIASREVEKVDKTEESSFSDKPEVK